MTSKIAELEQKIEQLENEKRRAGLSFHRIYETGADVEPLTRSNFLTLTENPKLCYKQADRQTQHKHLSLEETKGNITLIEGDNLPALTLLNLTHKNRVDIIYVDPPYNTGNTDFVYNDNRRSSVKDVKLADGRTVTKEDYEQLNSLTGSETPTEDPEKHSQWLSFMERRLILAKELLNSTGVIFVSIDDNEQAQLKLLMDSIFGEKNFIANMVWRNSSKSGSNKINTDHEYVLCYTKNFKQTQKTKWSTVKHHNEIQKMYQIVESNLNDLPSAKKLMNEYVKNLIKIDNDYTWLKNYSHVRVNNKNEPEIYYTVDLSVPGEPTKRELKNGITLPPLPDRGWQSAEKINKLIDQNLISWKGDRPYQINILNRTHKTGVSSVLPKIYTRNGKEELKRMFGNKAPFSFPKPLKLVKALLTYTDQKDAVILDFFAGSGTTAHAVAELNAEDGGQRQCILITHGDENGKNIAEEVTAVRLQKALSGEGWADRKTHPQLPGQLTYQKLGYTQGDLASYDTLAETLTPYLSLKHNTVLKETIQLTDGTQIYDLLSNPQLTILVVKNEKAYLNNQKEALTIIKQITRNYLNSDKILYTPKVKQNITSWEQKLINKTTYIPDYKTLTTQMKNINLIL